MTAPPSSNETSRVKLYTSNMILEGDIHLTKTGKGDRRLTNKLQGDFKFIAVSNVTMTDRQTGHTDDNIHPYIQVNVDSIEIIQPLEDD
ncbi:MAG: hypothetical protein KTR14_05390 [Vampirovibrio sp.]|nr:hypothetical protein [Vampirovibrio sp.]